MTTTKNTETTVLAHHGIVAAGGQNLIDAAREAGIIYACLGCGTVGGIDATADPFPSMSVEAARVATKEAILAADLYAFDCCPDADTILY